MAVSYNLRKHIETVHKLVMPAGSVLSFKADRSRTKAVDMSEDKSVGQKNLQTSDQEPNQIDVPVVRDEM
jgi:hypothetical protein